MDQLIVKVFLVGVIDVIDGWLGAVSAAGVVKVVKGPYVYLFKIVSLNAKRTLYVFPGAMPPGLLADTDCVLPGL